MQNKYAYWKQIRDKTNFFNNKVCCSSCGYIDKTFSYADYCPNCKARMIFEMGSQ